MACPVKNVLKGEGLFSRRNAWKAAAACPVGSALKGERLIWPQGCLETAAACPVGNIWKEGQAARLKLRGAHTFGDFTKLRYTPR